MKIYVIFDIETTCEENDDKESRELIEIGAYALDDNLNIISSFQKFCKPLVNPILTEFCKKLTGINQEDIEKAENFEKVITEFLEWIKICKQNKNIEIISWGNYDKEHLLRENIKKEINKSELIKLMKSHTNLKKEFENKFDIKDIEIPDALRIMYLSFEGNLHRGIDDAYNIVRIIKEIRE